MSATSVLVSTSPAAVAVLGGAAAGSVAGAVMTRWPRGRTLGRPLRSRCDDCGTTLAPLDLLPVLSWVRLGGRCRHCGRGIDLRVPMIEGAATVLVTVVVVVHGGSLDAVLYAYGAVAVLTASVIDLEHRIVPDRLTRPLAVVALAALALDRVPAGALVEALAWSLGVPASLALLAVVADRVRRPRPLGAGDIKLLVGVLALVAPRPGAPASLLLIAIAVGGIVAVAGLVTGRLERRSRLPFAPAIGIAYLLVVLVPDVAITVLPTIGGPA